MPRIILFIIFQGGERSNDALYTYQELLDKYGPSVPLLNGFAMALINLKRFDDAEKSLLEALEKVSIFFDTSETSFDLANSSSLEPQVR
jgi:hypothetical protein